MIRICKLARKLKVKVKMRSSSHSISGYNHDALKSDNVSFPFFFSAFCPSLSVSLNINDATIIIKPPSWVAAYTDFIVRNGIDGDAAEGN